MDFNSMQGMSGEFFTNIIEKKFVSALVGLIASKNPPLCLRIWTLDQHLCLRIWTLDQPLCLRIWTLVLRDL